MLLLYEKIWFPIPTSLYLMLLVFDLSFWKFMEVNLSLFYFLTLLKVRKTTIIIIFHEEGIGITLFFKI